MEERFVGSAEVERRMLIQALTATEKELSELVAAVCRVRTAIAQGASAEDFSARDCRMVVTVLANNSERRLNEAMGDAEKGERPEHIPTLMHITEMGLVAMKWLNVAMRKEGKVADGEGEGE